MQDADLVLRVFQGSGSVFGARCPRPSASDRIR